MPKDFTEFYTKWKCIKLTTGPPSKLTGVIGYVLEVHQHYLEFGEVTNQYEHFSNVSDPPIYKEYKIPFSEIIDIVNY